MQVQSHMIYHTSIQNVTGVGTVDTSTAGTYHITYDVSDSAGHSVNIIRTVNIQQLAPISLTNCEKLVQVVVC